MRTGLLDKQMYAWLATALKGEGYYFRALKTDSGMKYKLLKDLRVVSELIIDFEGKIIINGKEVK